MLDRLLTLCEQWIITVGLAVATLLVFMNVVARYVFDTGFPWVLEAVEYLFAWVVLIGAAHGIRAHIHLGIDLLVRKFSPVNQRRIALLALFMCLAFVVPVLALSVEYTYKIYTWGDLSLDLRIPQWIPYLAIPVGTGLMTLRFLQLGVKLWRGELLGISQSEHDQFKGGEIQE